MLNAITKRENINLEEYQLITKHHYITLFDRSYPNFFKHLDNTCVFIEFYKGNHALWKHRHFIAVYGEPNQNEIWQLKAINISSSQILFFYPQTLSELQNLHNALIKHQFKNIIILLDYIDLAEQIKINHDWLYFSPFIDESQNHSPLLNILFAKGCKQIFICRKHSHTPELLNLIRNKININIITKLD